MAATAALSDAGGVTEYFLTCLHLLVNVGMAMRDLVMSHKTIGTLSGLAQRLDDLEQAGFGYEGATISFRTSIVLPYRGSPFERDRSEER